MATRVNRKNPSSATTREVAGAEKQSKSESTGETTTGSNVGNRPSTNTTSIGKKIKQTKRKVGRPRTIGIKLKPTQAKKTKITRQLKKKILRSAKSLESRRKFLSNGANDNKIRKIRRSIKKANDDTPPILEPIFPIGENADTKNQFKKRIKKTVASTTELIDLKKIKVETDDDISLSSDLTDVSNAEAPNLKKQIKKQRGCKKIKTEIVEDTNVHDFLLTKSEIKTEVDCIPQSGKIDITTPKKFTRKQKMETLEFEPTSIKKEDIKVEPADTMPELEKNDIMKPKKLAKKQRIELLKKQILKKDNIANTLEKNGSEKVIDVLDLNVGPIKRKCASKRRHSIEKFPMSSVDDADTVSHLFNHLPRSLSPRSKRHARGRQSHEGFSRRSSPYSTRSDSPARILRNGKQRKWIDLNLVEGLDSDIKKRRRLCSDLSGSEMSVSKLSGYESDSSFSDLASSHGAENPDIDISVKTAKFKESFEEAAVDLPTNPIIENVEDKNVEIIDTNSNVCNNNVNKEPETEENIAVIDSESDSSINKVSEKSVILDIMKQTFNEIAGGDKSPKVTSDSSLSPLSFYGKDQSISILTKETSEETENKVELEEFNCEDEIKETDVISNNTIEEENSMEVEPAISNQTNISEDVKEDAEKDLSENIDTIEEDSNIITEEKLENACSVVEEHFQPFVISNVTSLSTLESEDFDQNTNYENELSLDNQESDVQGTEDTVQIIQDEMEPLVLGTDVNDSQSVEDESHALVCAEERLISDPELTEENNVQINDSGDGTVGKTFYESPVDITEKESILKVSNVCLCV